LLFIEVLGTYARLTVSKSPAGGKIVRMNLTESNVEGCHSTLCKYGQERAVPVEPGLQVAAKILRREDSMFKHRETVHMIHCQCQFCQVEV
jgi:hypothetical protein